MNILNSAIVLFLSSVLFVGCGSQENNNQESSADMETEAEDIQVGVDDNLQDEADFLIVSHLNSQLQITLGEIADRNALSPEVKSLSTSIIAENAKVLKNLEELANAAEIDLAPALTPEYIAIIDTIQTYQGAKFDSAFVNLVIEGHREDIDRLQDLAGKTENAIIRREVTENVSILQSQLNKAEEINVLME